MVQNLILKPLISPKQDDSSCRKQASSQNLILKPLISQKQDDLSN